MNNLGWPWLAKKLDLLVSKGPILFFDGVCNLCNSSVDFFISRDKKRILFYAPLQGKTATQVLSSDMRENLNSVVFFCDGHTFQRSKAIIEALKLLGGIYPLLARVLGFFPSPVRDGVYKLIAKNRYSLFGKRTSCRLPTEEESRYFLD